MHTEEILEVMDNVTQSLEEAIHGFEMDTCPVFPTKELKHKALGCQRRKLWAHSQQEQTALTQAPARKPKSLNLHTYKLHALGDYTISIRMYGTTDSYLMQAVSTCVYPCTLSEF